MKLYINGQDIEQFVVGIVDKDTILLQTYSVGPEEYLHTIVQFLQGTSRKIEDVKSIFVVQGPGSATSLRSSLAIVNTLVFALKISVVGVEKPPMVHDEVFVSQIIEPPSRDFVYPAYKTEPKITKTQKDALKRPIIS